MRKPKFIRDMEKDQAFCKRIVGDLLELEEGLTEWEIDFLESLSSQLEEGRTLTERQKEVLDRVYEDRVC